MWFLPLFSGSAGGARTEIVSAGQFSFVAQPPLVVVTKVLLAAQFAFTSNALVVAITKMLTAALFNFAPQLFSVTGEAIGNIILFIRRVSRR